MQWIKFLNLQNNWTSVKFKLSPSYYWKCLKRHVSCSQISLAASLTTQCLFFCSDSSMF